MIEGNFEDKYNSKNPIAQILVGNFLSTFKNLLGNIGDPKKILDVGTGEGYLTEILWQRFPDSQIWASDISKGILKVAKERLKSRGVHLDVGNVEELSYPDDSFDLSVCCEVLEHVRDPEKALGEIKRVTKGKVVVSVPQDPLWRVLNMARGKYLTDFGNTPGHLNHWWPPQFVKFVARSGLQILSIDYPLPWVMVLAKK